MRRTAFTGALLLLATMAGGARAQDWRTSSSARAFNGEKALRVDVEYAAGRLKLEPAAKGTLYRASMRYDASAFDPQIRYAGNALRVSMGDGHMRRNVKGGELNLRLGPQAPLALALQFGAAEANLDVGGLRVRNVTIQTGASATVLTVSRPNPEVCEHVDIDVGAARFEATGLGNLNARTLELSGGVGEVILDFTGQWRGNMDAKIDMGLGSLTIRVPRGLGLQVQKEGLLAGFDSQGLVKRGNVYYSEGFDRAQHRLAIRLNAAFGSVKVDWTN